MDEVTAENDEFEHEIKDDRKGMETELISAKVIGAVKVRGKQLVRNTNFSLKPLFNAQMNAKIKLSPKIEPKFKYSSNRSGLSHHG